MLATPVAGESDLLQTFGVQFGVIALLDDRSVSVTQLAQEVEAAGLESLFLTEHTHVPVRRETNWPPGRTPKDESRFLDPLIALTAAAAVSTRLRLGTGVCIVSQRDPILLAKEVATLDHLSNGRFIFGVGAGWVIEELRNHGVDIGRRWSIAEERVKAIREIWTHEEAEFHGKYVDFDAIGSWPKPVQQPHPPILVGGNGPRALDRAVHLGNGWMPISLPGLQLAEAMADLERAARQAGKPTPPTTLCLWHLDAEMLRRARDAGVARCVVNVPVATMDRVSAALQHYGQAIRALT